uniref:Uncharacterized protein n=1 Tax=Oryzias sinensis TaxID=183150 RepID=A0A8C7WY96_9TELE
MAGLLQYCSLLLLPHLDFLPSYCHKTHRGKLKQVLQNRQSVCSDQQKKGATKKQIDLLKQEPQPETDSEIRHHLSCVSGGSGVLRNVRLDTLTDSVLCQLCGRLCCF